MSDLMIYGATGYTGKLCANEAVKAGLSPILAGRSQGSLETVAGPLGLDVRAFRLDNPIAVSEGLNGVSAVLNCAGPFEDTAAAMVAGCLQTGTHYLDITGEPDVFASLLAQDDAAKEKGVMLLPGCGFDVVPTDCTAAMLAAQMPDALDLTMAFAGMTQPSQGTLRTVLREVAEPQKRLQNGQIAPFDNLKPIEIDFGDGPEKAVPNTWGDLVTAPVSTGIQNVSIYFVPPDSAKPLLALPGWVKRLLGTSGGQRMLNWYIDRQVAGPDSETLDAGYARVYGRAKNAAGEVTESLLETPEAYALTAISAVALLNKAGEAGVPGFQTPSTFAGAEFVTTLPGVKRL